MNRHSLRVLLPLLLLTPATMTLAQDSPPRPASKKPPATRPASPAQTLRARSSKLVKVRTIKGQLGDLEALRAADDAEKMRRRAACMLAAADEMDKAAKRLDKATGEKRNHELDAVESAADLAYDCDEPPDDAAADEVPEAQSTLAGATVSGACVAEQANCDKAFGNGEWSKLLSDQQSEFVGCYEEALGRRPDLAGATRFMLRLGKGETAGEVDDLRIEKDGVDDIDLLECQADVVRGMTFPEAADGRTLRFTVRHTSVKPKPRQFATPPPP